MNRYNLGKFGLVPLSKIYLEMPKNVDDFPETLFKERFEGFYVLFLVYIFFLRVQCCQIFFTTEEMLFQLHLSRVIVVANGLFS